MNHADDGVMNHADKGRIDKFYKYTKSKIDEATRIVEECKKEAKQFKDNKILKKIGMYDDAYSIHMFTTQKKIPKKYEEEHRNLSKYISQDSMEKLRKAFLNIESNDFGNDFIDMIDDNLLYHLSIHMDAILEIEPYQYKIFLNTIKEIHYFKKSGFPTNTGDYINKVNSLKNKADELQKLSKEQIKIKIPILEHDSLYYLVYYLRKENVKEQNIKALFDYFTYEDYGKKNLPKSANDFNRFFEIRTKLHTNKDDTITSKTYIYTPPYNYAW